MFFSNIASLRRLSGGLCVATLCATLLPGPVLAGPFSMNGRIKQGVTVAYDHESRDDFGPTNFLGEVALEYKPNRQFSLYADLWIRGDIFPYLESGLEDRGIQNFNSPDFREQFRYSLSGEDAFAGDTPFAFDEDSVRLYDDWNDVLRDVSMTYRAKNRSFLFKIGKFQHGWGQSDGLRLIDILNPQDFRHRFALADAQDWRIPQTGALLKLDFARLGLSAPFSWLGLERPALELVYYPQVLHSKFVVNNPTPSDQTSGGIYGFPYPELIDPQSDRGLPFIGVNLHDVEHQEWDWKQGEMGVRFGFEALGAVITLNGFYGYQDLPVVTLQGGNLLVGTNYNDPEQALQSVSLTPEASVLATWAPGAYIDQVRGFGTLSQLGQTPLLAPLLGQLTSTLSPFGCTSLVVTEGCSVNFDLNLDYDYRQKVVAASLTREINELKIGRKQVSPVLRVEASYEVDKPFNNQVTETGYLNEGVGSAALIALPENAISFSDQLGIMAGFDFPLWIPFWDSQRNSIFTSFQFFDFYTREHENKVLQAPYMFTGLAKHQQYATALWISEHFNEMLVLEGLLAVDLTNNAIAYRQRIDFNMFGDSIRPRIEWLAYDAQREEGVFGFVHDADTVEFSLTFQF